MQPGRAQPLHCPGERHPLHGAVPPGAGTGTGDRGQGTGAGCGAGTGTGDRSSLWERQIFLWESRNQPQESPHHPKICPNNRQYLKPPSPRCCCNPDFMNWASRVGEAALCYTKNKPQEIHCTSRTSESKYECTRNEVTASNQSINQSIII